MFKKFQKVKTNGKIMLIAGIESGGYYICIDDQQNAWKIHETNIVAI